MSAQRIRSLLMRPELAAATIDRRKVQTLRMMVRQLGTRPGWACYGPAKRKETDFWHWYGENPEGSEHFADEWPARDLQPVCPYGDAGDRLAIRENYRFHASGDRLVFEDGSQIVVPNDPHMQENPLDWFRAAREKHGGKLRPSIFLPSWAGRVRVLLTGVAPQRLQEITNEQAEREGVGFWWKGADGQRRTANGWEFDGENVPKDKRDYLRAFCDVWSALHGAKSWDVNPWVWRLEFTAEPRPFDLLEGGVRLYHADGRAWN